MNIVLPEHDDVRVQRVIDYFEHLNPESLLRLSEIYAPMAHFKDPFNDVRGLKKIEGIFKHMYVNLHEPRFVVTRALVQGDEVVLMWDFLFHFQKIDPHAQQSIKGCSHLKFNDLGLITEHRDYWDAAEELYEKLPLIGGLMRWLKRRVNS